ncbi:glyoxalase-like domain-containing protein [Crassisporium funariophilum]|nr:glyoxalase-like domain-containing protein [Crassisporium funariophilum]
MSKQCGQDTNTRTLDHLVHLTPPGSVETSSKQFRELGFNVLPGGTHAGGLTANALVVLDDGVYLELISFTHPASHYPPGSEERTQRDNHSWAAKLPGWIDYAFLGNGSHQESISAIINQRGRKDDSGVVYGLEQDGGRQRQDGEILKWLISAPEPQQRGILPFFCGDVTSRQLRVPSEPPENTQHPSTARGIAYIRVLSDSASFSRVLKQLNSVIGHEPVSSTQNESSWLLDTVHETKKKPRLILSTAGNDDETAFLDKSAQGFYEVGFYVDEGGKSGSQSTPYGRIVWVT